MPLTPQTPVVAPTVTIDPARSWLDYRSAIETIISTGAAVHKPSGSPLAGVTVSTTNSKDGSTSVAAATKISVPNDPDGGTGFKLPAIQGKVPTATVQYPSAGTLIVRLSGYAIRAGYRINPPSLVSFANQTPVLLDAYVREEVIGNVGIAIYSLIWEIDYVMPYSPDNGIPKVAPNQLLGDFSEG